MTTTPLREATRNEQPMSSQVLEAVAEQEGTTLLALDQPLYEAVDPDALDHLFAGDRRPDTVRFSYSGYEVSISGDGRIAVTDVD